MEAGSPAGVPLDCSGACRQAADAIACAATVGDLTTQRGEGSMPDDDEELTAGRFPRCSGIAYAYNERNEPVPVRCTLWEGHTHPRHRAYEYPVCGNYVLWLKARASGSGRS